MYCRTMTCNGCFSGIAVHMISSIVVMLVTEEDHYF